MTTNHGSLDNAPALVHRKWIDARLRRTGPRDDAPSATVLNHWRSLGPDSQLAFKQAAAALLHNLLLHGGTGEDPRYFAELVRVAVGMELKGLAGELAAFALSKRLRFRTPSTQQTVLRTLVDLRSEVPPDFWTAVAPSPPMLTFPFTALLDVDRAAAVRALEAMPDDEAVADCVHVILDQRRGCPDLQALAAAVQECAPRCRPEVTLALAEWLSDLPDPALPPAEWVKQLSA